jgi:uncharacterized membrane protein HdeD (DUF308 family)
MATEDRSTFDLLRSSRITAYTLGALALVAGLVLLFWPDRTVVVVARILGILFVVTGFGQALEAVTAHRSGSYWGLLLLRGLVNLGFGLVLIFWPDVTVNVVVWLIGLDLVITGLLGLIVSGRVPEDMGRSSLRWQCVITIVVGIVIMVWPSESVNVIAVLVAILLILIGLVLLASGYQLRKARVVTTG